MVRLQIRHGFSWPEPGFDRLTAAGGAAGPRTCRTAVSTVWGDKLAAAASYFTTRTQADFDGRRAATITLDSDGGKANRRRWRLGNGPFVGICPGSNCHELSPTGKTRRADRVSQKRHHRHPKRGQCGNPAQPEHRSGDPGHSGQSGRPRAAIRISAPLRRRCSSREVRPRRASRSRIALGARAASMPSRTCKCARPALCRWPPAPR